MAEVGRILSSSSAAIKLALIGLLATMVIHIVGYSTNYWTRVATGLVAVKRGLWQDCVCWTFYKEQCICAPIPIGTSWSIDTVRALESVGLAGIVFTLLLSTIGLLKVKGKAWKIASIVTCFLSFFSVLVGITIYGVAVAPGSFHFSFVLCVLSGVGLLVCACLLIADRHTKPRPAGGTVVHYNANQVAVGYQPYGNQGYAYVGPQYQTGIQPPPYQFYPSYTVSTVGQAQVASGSYTQPPQADPPPGYGTK